MESGTNSISEISPLIQFELSQSFLPGLGYTDVLL